MQFELVNLYLIVFGVVHFSSVEQNLQGNRRKPPQPKCGADSDTHRHLRYMSEGKFPRSPKITKRYPFFEAGKYPRGEIKICPLHTGFVRHCYTVLISWTTVVPFVCL